MTAVDRKQARKWAGSYAWSRIAIGGCAAALPAVAGAAWVGKEESRRTGSKVFARGLGARDIALGVGMLLALQHDAPVRGWVEASGLADTGDTISTLLAFARLPRRLRWALLALAAGGVAVACVLAPNVDAA